MTVTSMTKYYWMLKKLLLTTTEHHKLKTVKALYWDLLFPRQKAAYDLTVTLTNMSNQLWAITTITDRDSPAKRMTWDPKTPAAKMKVLIYCRQTRETQLTLSETAFTGRYNMEILHVQFRRDNTRIKKRPVQK
jgi:hypothetical protein